jgi:hypothetical protein
MSSQFQLFSIGYVAENKAPGTRHVNCIPVEDAPGFDGEITFAPSDQILKGMDSEGNQYQVKVTTDVSVQAEWLPNGTNRVTPPDVQRGELVELFRMGDTDQIYWRCMGLRDNLRRLETVVYAFNASPENSNTNGVNFSNCYFFEISGHNRHITLGTSQANGEPFAYTFQFNTGEGAVNLIDNIGNQIELDSRDRRLQLKNADGSFVKVEKKVITTKADEKIEFECGGSRYTMTPAQIKLKTAAYVVEADSVLYKTSSFDIDG